jgi:pimeloyl-ACP methyl ester carboxylesterase
VEISIRSADGTQLAARRVGRGSPVVLVHGSAGGLDSWSPVEPLLQNDFELWTFARRGYRPSDGCRRPKDFRDDVADLRAVIRAAGGSAHVVGASYGATVALHAALEGTREPLHRTQAEPPSTPGGVTPAKPHSEDSVLRSVTVFEPPLFAAASAAGEVLAPYRELVEAGELAAAAHLFAAKVARVPAAILAALGDSPQDPGEARGCVHDLEAMAADTTDIERWSRIRLPMLLISGSDTWTPMPAVMEALSAALPDANRVVLAGQSHFATHTAPALFAETVLAHLHRHEP